MLASFEHYVGHDFGLILNLLKIFVQHRAILLVQQCCTMLASFEQALTSYRTSRKELMELYIRRLDLYTKAR